MRLVFGLGAAEPLDLFLFAGVCWQVGEGTARTLRTTQWTRASFELVFDRFILMILKIISQFRVGLLVPTDSLIKLM